MTDQPTQLSGHVVRDYDQAIATLRQAWLTRGPKTAALARRMGCSRPQASAWLRGEIGAVAVRRLLALAGALGFDLALVPRDGDGPSAPTVSPLAAQNGSGVPEGTLGGSGGSESRTDRIADGGIGASIVILDAREDA